MYGLEQIPDQSELAVMQLTSTPAQHLMSLTNTQETVLYSPLLFGLEAIYIQQSRQGSRYYTMGDPCSKCSAVGTPRRKHHARVYPDGGLSNLQSVDIFALSASHKLSEARNIVNIALLAFAYMVQVSVLPELMPVHATVGPCARS